MVWSELEIVYIAGCLTMKNVYQAASASLAGPTNRASPVTTTPSSMHAMPPLCLRIQSFQAADRQQAIIETAIQQEIGNTIC